MIVMLSKLSNILSKTLFYFKQSMYSGVIWTYLTLESASMMTILMKVLALSFSKSLYSIVFYIFWKRKSLLF